MSYTGHWSYHPLVVSVAETNEDFAPQPVELERTGLCPAQDYLGYQNRRDNQQAFSLAD